MTSSRISINVSGLNFETRLSTLSRFPETLLGDQTKRLPYYCSTRNEYMFNRHRDSFESILLFYQSQGKLYCPKNVNLRVFLDECDFFQLPKWAIDDVKRREGGFLQEKLLQFFQKDPHQEGKDDNLPIRTKVPSSSVHAQYFSVFNVLLLSVSIVINCIKTVPNIRSSTLTTSNNNEVTTVTTTGAATTTNMFAISTALATNTTTISTGLSKAAIRNTSLSSVIPLPSVPGRIVHSHDAWEIADITINVYFLIEFILRVTFTPKRFDLCKSFLAWIDFIALVTFIPVVNKHYMNESVILFFTPFQLFRVIRILRVTKLLPGFNITEIIMKDSFGYLEIFVTWLLFATSIGAVLLYSCEGEGPGTEFTSLPQSQYWAIQTAVTLGYGDIVPSTALGKLFAACFIIGFVPTIYLPALAILARFSQFYEFCKAISE